MKAETVKFLCPKTVNVLDPVEVAPGVIVWAWVDLADMNIYHKINGELMALVFPALDAFAKHIEQITETQNTK